MTTILLLAAAVLGFIVVFGVSGCTRPAESTSTAGVAVTTRRVKSMSQAKIREMLATIEKKIAPEPKMGAMCYEMASPPDRAEYVCPKCGEKTLYTKDAAREVEWELESCRREFLKLKASTGLLLALDESSYCSHCRPDAKTHALTLVVTYADGSSHTNAAVTAGDLRILQGFLRGDGAFKTFNEGEEPLKQQLPRLRELLGVPAHDGAEGG